MGVTQPSDIPSKATRANKQQASFNFCHVTWPPHMIANDVAEVGSPKVGILQI